MPQVAPERKSNSQGATKIDVGISDGEILRRALEDGLLRSIFDDDSKHWGAPQAIHYIAALLLAGATRGQASRIFRETMGAKFSETHRRIYLEAAVSLAGKVSP